VPRGFCPGADAVLGFCDTRDRRVLTYLIPDTLLFLRCSDVRVFGDWTGIQLINRWYVLLIVRLTRRTTGGLADQDSTSADHQIDGASGTRR